MMHTYQPMTPHRRSELVMTNTIQGRSDAAILDMSADVIKTADAPAHVMRLALSQEQRAQNILAAQWAHPDCVIESAVNYLNRLSIYRAGKA